MKIEEIKQYPIGEKGLKMLTSKHQFKYGKQEILTVRGINEEDEGQLNIEFLHNEDLIFSNHLNPLKPILFPISSLTKEIEVHGEKFIILDKMAEILHNHDDCNCEIEWCKEWIECTHNTDLPYFLIKILFENYFDVFGLIDKGEAISVLQLPENPYKL